MNGESLHNINERRDSKMSGWNSKLPGLELNTEEQIHSLEWSTE